MQQGVDPYHSAMAVAEFKENTGGLFGAIILEKKNMKILFLGDSITQGDGASSVDKNYVNLVKETLKCEVVNYALAERG